VLPAIINIIYAIPRDFTLNLKIASVLCIYGTYRAGPLCDLTTVTFDLSISILHYKVTQ